MSAPKAKRQKTEKLKTKFKAEYTRTNPFIVPSSLGPHHARCSLCSIDFGVGYGGKNDITLHVESAVHKTAVISKERQASVATFFQKEDPMVQKVTNSELLFNKFVVEHNLPLSVFDHAGPLFRAMFKDSATAQQFACGRSKAQAQTKFLARDITQELVEQLREHPFTIATDGSNDGDDQLYPVVCRHFDEKAGKVVSDLLVLAPIEGSSTGENIFLLMEQVLDSHKIPWTNCLSLSCDNASVMTGVHNGVAAFAKRKQPNLYVMGCPCHLLHIAARTASKELHIETDQAIVDIYFYLDKSSKRKKAFSLFLKDAGLKVQKFLKYGATRWLSLRDCVIRLLDQWPALDEFFKAELEAVKEQHRKSPRYDRLNRIRAYFENSMSKCYAVFLAETLPIFVNANLALQMDSPQLHTILDRLNEVVTDLLVRFVKSSAIRDSKDIFTLDHGQRSKQLSRDELMIGSAVRDCLKITKEAGTLSPEQETTFFRDVRSFFSEATSYILSKFPLKDGMLENARVLNISNRQSHKFAMLEYFVDKYPCLLAGGSKDQLQLEFNKYKIDFLPGLDQTVGIDQQWHFVGTLLSAEGHLKYPLLVHVMKGLTILPHSNADCERIFSLVRKNKTEFRPNLAPETLSALLVQKIHMASRGICCHEVTFSTDQLQQAKNAYAASLKK